MNVNRLVVTVLLSLHSVPALGGFVCFISLGFHCGNSTLRAIEEADVNGRRLLRASEDHHEALLPVNQFGNETIVIKEKPRIAIVTMLAETEVKAYNDFNDYQMLSTMALQSILEYGTRWGYPVFFLNDHLMDKSRQAYWSKINIIRHYLETMDFDYVLYTDIDVLINDPTKPLEDFIVEGYDLISVNECKDRNQTNDIIRSGFMMFRNSIGTRKFLDAWVSMFEAYENIENPEQSALELLVTMPEFSDSVLLHNWKYFHSYDTCSGGEKAFSMHFPGAYKPERVARMVAWLSMTNPQAFKAQSLPQLLGFGSSMQTFAYDILRKGLVSLSKIPLGMKNPHELDSFKSSMTSEGYDVLNLSPSDLQQYQEAVWRYEESTYFWAIPNVIYFTVKDHSDIHPDIQERIEKWRNMNPDFEVVVVDDKQLNEFVLSMLDISEDVWNRLEPVQRIDIWRYLVIHTFGGWYFDADVDAVRPISEWEVEPRHNLVVGVEADNYAEGAPKHEGSRPLTLSQYGFGAAPQHPALKRVLERIVELGETLIMTPGMSVQERLTHVLTTTGPVVWTDSIFEFFAVSASSFAQQPQTPADLHLGGNNMNAKVFGVAGFGCGQFHSNSPGCDEEKVNIWHRFGGSQYFRDGKRWQALPSEGNVVE